MKSWVGYSQPPKGGFGNRALSYLSLRQIAHVEGARYFSQKFPDRSLLAGIEKRRPIVGRFQSQVVVRTRDYTPEDLLNTVRELLHKPSMVTLRGPLLGEVLARCAVIDSRALTKLKARLCGHHQRERRNQALVTFHLRGGDFAQWNPEAILQVDYYLDAYHLLEKRIDGHLLRICSDDPTHPALLPLRRELLSRKFKVSRPDCSSPFRCDLAAMSQSQYLISSPSTFAMTAGLLGEAQIVHSARWVANRVERGELFWQKVQNNRLIGYPVIGLV